MCSSSTHQRGDHGQATIAMVGVIALALAAMVAFSVFAEAIVHRARARNAADAVALAAATDTEAADALASWYTEREVVIERSGTRTIARSGPSQAAAWATAQPATGQPAPALIAILARAEQLLGTGFVSVQWQSTAIMLAAGEAASLRTVAVDLGLCERPPSATAPGIVAFELC